MSKILIISARKPDLKKVKAGDKAPFPGASAMAIQKTLLPEAKYEDVVLSTHRDMQVRQDEKALIKASVQDGSYIYIVGHGSRRGAEFAGTYGQAVDAPRLHIPVQAYVDLIVNNANLKPRDAYYPGDTLHIVLWACYAADSSEKSTAAQMARAFHKKGINTVIVASTMKMYAFHGKFYDDEKTQKAIRFRTNHPSEARIFKHDQHGLVEYLPKNQLYFNEDGFQSAPGVNPSVNDLLDKHAIKLSQMRLYDLWRTFVELTPAECRSLCIALKNKQLMIDMGGSGFSRILEKLNLPQRAAVYETWKDKLPELIRDAWGFDKVFRSLTTEQRTEVYAALKNKLPDLVKGNSDLPHVLNNLNLAQCRWVCTAVKARLPSIFINGFSFSYMLDELNSEARIVVLDVWRNELQIIIKSAGGFSSVLEKLNVAQRTVIYDIWKDKLPELIQDGCEFSSVLQHLSAEQRTEVFEALKEKLPGFAKYAWGLGKVLQYLNPDQCASVCDGLTAKWSKIFKNSEDFNVCLAPLDPGQRTSVFNSTQEWLPELIKSAHDFKAVLEHLNAAQRTFVFRSLSERLPNFIENYLDFEAVLTFLNPDQRTIIFISTKQKLPEITKRELREGCVYWGFESVLVYLNSSQQCLVLNSMKEKLLDVIEEDAHFKAILRLLKPEPRTLLFNWMKDRLPDLVISEYDFYGILECLNPEQRRTAIVLMKEQLPNVIKDYAKLASLLRDLEPEQCGLVCTALKNKLPRIIKNATNLGLMLKDLDLEQLRSVCMVLKDSLPMIVKDQSALIRCMLKPLTPEQCHCVCTALKDQMPIIDKIAIYLCEILTIEQCDTVYDVLKDKIRDSNIMRWQLYFRLFGWHMSGSLLACRAMEGPMSFLILRPIDLSRMLLSSSMERCRLVINVMKDELPKIICSARDFREVMEPLDPARRTFVYVAMQDNLSDLIHDIKSFFAVIEYLNPFQSGQACAALSGKLRSLNRSAHDLDVLRNLSIDQCRVMFAALKGQLSSLITNQRQLDNMLHALHLEQYKLFCTAIKDELPKDVNNAKAFNHLLVGLYCPDRCRILCSEWKDTLLKVVRSPVQLSCLLNNLKPEHCRSVCISLKPNLTKTVKNAQSLNSVLKELEPEQCRILCSVMEYEIEGSIKPPKVLEPKLCRIPRSVIDYGDEELIQGPHALFQILKGLKPEQCRSVCLALKDQLPKFANSAQDFAILFRLLEPEQYAPVCAFLTDNLRKVITMVEHLATVLRILDVQQCRSVCSALKDEFLNIVSKAEDLAHLCKELTYWQRVAVYLALEEWIPQLVNCARDFAHVLRFLPEQHTDVCNSFRSQLPNLNGIVEDLRHVLRYLYPWQCRQICLDIKDKLPVSEGAIRYYGGLFEYLDPQQCNMVCTALNDKLQLVLKSRQDIELLIKPLAKEQRKIITAFMEENFAELLSTDEKNRKAQVDEPQSSKVSSVDQAETDSHDDNAKADQKNNLMRSAANATLLQLEAAIPAIDTPVKKITDSPEKPEMAQREIPNRDKNNLSQVTQPSDSHGDRPRAVSSNTENHASPYKAFLNQNLSDFITDCLQNQKLETAIDKWKRTGIKDQELNSLADQCVKLVKKMRELHTRKYDAEVRHLAQVLSKVLEILDQNESNQRQQLRLEILALVDIKKPLLFGHRGFLGSFGKKFEENVSKDYPPNTVTKLDNLAKVVKQYSQPTNVKRFEGQLEGQVSPCKLN